MAALVPQSVNQPSTTVSGTYYPAACTYNLQERDFLNPYANAHFRRMKGKRAEPNLITSTPYQQAAATQAAQGGTLAGPVGPPPPPLSPVEMAQIQRQQMLAQVNDPTTLSNQMIQQRYAAGRGKRLLTVNDVQNVDKEAQTLWNEKLLTDQMTVVGIPGETPYGAYGAAPSLGAGYPGYPGY